MRKLVELFGHCIIYLISLRLGFGVIIWFLLETTTTVRRSERYVLYTKHGREDTAVSDCRMQYRAAIWALEYNC